MEIKDKSALRNKILNELYVSWEKGEHEYSVQTLKNIFDSINEIDLDRQVLYLKEKYLIEINGDGMFRNYLNFSDLKITSDGIDLVENKEEYNSFFKIEFNNIQDIHNSVISKGNYNKINNINNEMDEIIKILDKKDIEQKEEIKKLLAEFQKTKDKSKLEKVLSNLANTSGIGSLITSIIALLK